MSDRQAIQQDLRSLVRGEFRVMGSVLFVDPDQAIYGSIYRRLFAASHQLEHLTSAEDLFVRLQQGALPDVIVLEKYQPDMDGLRICSLFRRLRGCHDIPLVMVSEAAGLQDYEKALALGAFDYISKPFAAEHLQERVQAAMAERAVHLQLQQLFAHSVRPSAEAPSCDRLTRLPGLGAFQLALQKAIEAYPLQAQPISLTLVDLDFFSFYHQAFGQEASNACLQKLAEVLRKIGPEETLFRIQVDRFACLVSPQNSDAALKMAQRFCERTRLLKIPHASVTGQQHLSISVGTATLKHGHPYTSQQLLESAEQALFQAKTWGRNQVRQFFEL